MLGAGLRDASNHRLITAIATWFDRYRKDRIVDIGSCASFYTAQCGQESSAAVTRLTSFGTFE